MTLDIKDVHIRNYELLQQVRDDVELNEKESELTRRLRILVEDYRKMYLDKIKSPDDNTVYWD